MLATIFQKKHFGFKSKAKKIQYNIEFDRINKGTVEKLNFLLRAKKKAYKKEDFEKANRMIELIWVVRAQHKNDIAELNNKY